MPRRRLLVPEVVQTSNMDCGPAALKCLLEGFGTHASYGRLREACQTDVDGTSIDTMEDVARQLGLDAEQIMLPVDHLLLPEAKALPAIVVVRQAGGTTHFVVAWRRHGRLLQLMDPAVGRRWTTCARFKAEVYVHQTMVAAEAWREWAGSDGFVAVLRRRLRDLGIHRRDWIEAALSDPAWHSLAALDAAVRMTSAMVASGGLSRGRWAARVLESLLKQPEMVPAEYWQVQRHDDQQVVIRGAVLVHVGGPLAASAKTEWPVSPDLAAALKEPPCRPVRELLRLLAGDGLLTPAMLVMALLLGAFGSILEALLFAGSFNLARELALPGQRMGAIAVLLGFLGTLLLLEMPLAAGVLRFGHRLEARLRLAFLEKIPRLGDRYFHSRMKSDMAERSHSICRIRNLPDLAGQFVRAVFELILTVAGIAWLDPACARLAILAAAVGVGLPLALQPLIVERDLRIRNHTGALSRFYLDALLGLVPIRVHGAERAVRREHGRLLVDWARAGAARQRAAVCAETAQFTAGLGLAAWLLLDHLARHGEDGGVLLLTYWALNLPVIGQGIAQAAWQYPALRNVTLRLLEPLGAPEETPGRAGSKGASVPTQAVSGMSMVLANVSVRVSGRNVLEDIDLAIAPGTHVAIVGPSGAGKSSLVGILLGWYRPWKGSVVVDDAPLDGRIEELRSQIAWVDPAVHLWNRSFYGNLCYGAAPGSLPPIGDVIEAADLRSVLEKLPDGFETPLGEGGALVSGGEGQRVRLGRAMCRTGARLAILDEPFRGLERQQRGELLKRARKLWQERTLICITHDIEETRTFDRVLVIESGRIVEDGDPTCLAQRLDSRYRAMLEAETAVRDRLWAGAEWRRLRLKQGHFAA